MQRSNTSATEPDLQPFKTPAEAAAIITGTTEHWLKRQAYAGLIPCQRVTGKRIVMFSADDIQQIKNSFAQPAIADVRSKSHA